MDKNRASINQKGISMFKVAATYIGDGGWCRLCFRTGNVAIFAIFGIRVFWGLFLLRYCSWCLGTLLWEWERNWGRVPS